MLAALLAAVGTIEKDYLEKRSSKHFAAVTLAWLTYFFLFAWVLKR